MNDVYKEQPYNGLYGYECKSIHHEEKKHQLSRKDSQEAVTSLSFEKVELSKGVFNDSIPKPKIIQSNLPYHNSFNVLQYLLSVSAVLSSQTPFSR